MNGSISGLETAALKLINNIISKSPNVAEQIRLQCEFQESGFDVKALEKVTIRLLYHIFPTVVSFIENEDTGRGSVMVNGIV